MKTDTFPSWLLEILKERKMNQSELASAAGVASGSISDIISGRRRVGKNLALAIAKGLRLPPEIVFEKAGFKQKEREGFMLTLDQARDILAVLPDWIRGQDPRRVNDLLLRLCREIVVSPDGALTVCLRSE